MCGRDAGQIARTARDHQGPAAQLSLIGHDLVPVGCPADRGDGRMSADRRRTDRGEARDERDHLRRGHVTVWIRTVVAIAGQASLPVRRQQAQGVPALAPPGVGDLTAIEHEMIDPVLDEAAARRQSGVTCPDDDRRDVLDDRDPDRPCAAALGDFDGDVGRIGDRVVDRGALLRLGHDGLDLFL